MYCRECGGKLKIIGVIGNTQKCVCGECYVENIRFVPLAKCEHDFNSKKICIHCGQLDNA